MVKLSSIPTYLALLNSIHTDIICEQPMFLMRSTHKHNYCHNTRLYSPPQVRPCFHRHHMMMGCCVEINVGIWSAKSKRNKSGWPLVGVLLLSSILASWQPLPSFHWRKTKMTFFLFFWLGSGWSEAGGRWKVQWQPVTGFNIQLLVSCPTALLPSNPAYHGVLGGSHRLGGWVGGWANIQLHGGCLADNTVRQSTQ